MQVYNNPSIYFEETIASEEGSAVVVRKPPNYQPKAVASAEMGIGAFVGTAIRGEIDTPVLVNNWTEFVNKFGGFSKDSMLAYAVQGYFLNGGEKAYIVRTTKHDESGVTTAVKATATVNGASDKSALTITAKSAGVQGNEIGYEIKDVTANKFTLNIYLKGILAHTYLTTFDTIEIDSEESPLVTIVAGEEAPVATALATLVGGDDGLTGIGDTDYTKAIDTLIDTEFNALAVPSVSSMVVHKYMDDFCDKKTKCSAYKDVPAKLTATEVATYREQLGHSARGRMIYPRLKVSDPIGLGKDPVKEIPACGHVMGFRARYIKQNGVWNAVAGTDTVLTGIRELATKVTDTDIGILNPLGITCLKVKKNVGIVIWGARTFSDNKDMKYANVRDTVDFVELSLQNSMDWSNFKGNNPDLWGKIALSVTNFLTALWGQGGLKGEKMEDAFWVKCDSEVNTPEVVDNGITYCDIGLALSKPNEFTVFRMNING